MELERLQPKDIPTVRADLLALHQGRCALCKLPILSDPCLDHNHAQPGQVRDVLHRGCNALLGAIERGRSKGVLDIQAFADGVGNYLRKHQQVITPLRHPAFRTPTEKVLLAKKRRVRKKNASKLSRT